MKDLSDAVSGSAKSAADQVDAQAGSEETQNSGPVTLPSGRMRVGSTPTSHYSSRQLTCRVVRAESEFTGKQGLRYAPGISAQTVGAQNIHLQILTMPPGARAKAHRHDEHETAIYILSGESGVWYGENLEQRLFAGSGDFVYIPASMPHLPYNVSDTDPCVALIARTDPNEQESVVLLPDLDSIHAPEAGPQTDTNGRE